MATRNTNITVPKLVKPTVGKHVDTWGYILNENFDKLSEFHTKIVSDSEMQNQELARLENEKLNIEDIPSKVEPVVQEFLETTIKPEIDDYIDTVSKPDITKHVETKKQEINTYVNTTSKPALDAYEKGKEEELNTYTTTKKGELDSHTIAKKGELDAYEKTKETQLNNYTGTKQTQLDSYTNTKKGELDTHTTAKEGQLDTYTTGKEGELDTHTGKKKSELDAYEKTKEGELNTFTSTKKTEITNHTNTKKRELDTYTTQKKGEITTHTDSEIERINADSELAKKQNITDSRLQTESKEIVGAINESLWKIVAKQINNNDDLNNYKTSGMFMSKSSNFNILNKPKDFRGDGALFLSVFALAPSIVKQVIYNYVNNQTFERRWNTDNWSEWAEILNNDSKLFLGTSGISSVTYIQDSGTKTQGQGYIDKSTGQVYLCLETNTDTTITNKFMSITNVELGKKVESGFWKLNSKIINDGNFDILGIYEPGFYMPDSDGIQANWLNKPYVNAMCYGLLYQKQNGSRRSVIYIGSNGEIYTNVQVDNGSSKAWIGWKKAITNADIVDNLTTADKSKVLSANMGKYLDADKPSKNKEETITNYWTFESKTPFIKFKKTGEQSLPSAGYSAFIGFGSSARPHELQISNLYDDGTVNIVSTNLKTGNKDIPKAINEVYDSQLGTQGISSIIYIQDAGEKTAGNGYIDKTTGQLYLCKTTNSDITVTNKFVLATNIENSKKLDNLSAKIIAFNTSNGLADTLKDLLLKGYKNIIVSFEGSIASPIEINLTTDTESGTNKNSFLGALVSFQIWNYGEITLRNISYDGGLKSFTSNKIGAVMTIIYSKNGVPLVYSNNLYNVVS